MDAKEALELRRRQILERLAGEAMRIQPGYHTVREELIRPDRQETETAYFWDRWAPRLGPSATLLVVRMRQACRRAGSPADRDLDAAVTLSYQEIGRFTGMSGSTIKRLLQQEDVCRFIRKEAQMRESAIGRVDAPNRYVVMMTDPLNPEDEERLRVRLADRLLTQELLGSPAGASRRPGIVAPPPAQNGLASPAQNDPTPHAQNEPAARGQKSPASRVQNDPGAGRKRPSIMAVRPRLEPTPGPSCTTVETMQNVKEHEDPNVNVDNVNEIHHYKTDPRVEAWASRLVDLTGDEKSINFYRKAVRILLQRKAEGVLDHAAGLVKEAIREGTARRPAALLTSTLLSLAEERGIFITERSREEVEQIRNAVRDSLRQYTA